MREHQGTFHRVVALVALAALLAVAAAPAGNAEETRPSNARALVTTDVGARDAPERASWRVAPGDLAPSHLEQAGMLVTTPAALAGASRGVQVALERFLAASKPVVLVSGGTADGYELLPNVDGGDARFFGDADGFGIEERTTPAAQAVGVWRLGNGATMLQVWAFEDDVTMRELILASVHEWRRAGGRDGSGHVGDDDVSLMSTSSADEPAWGTMHIATFCFETAPYGQLCYRATFRVLVNDASTHYDWWNVLFTTHTSPGKVRWGNNWHTNRQWATSYVPYYKPHKLVDYGPESAINVAGVAYEIGPREGTFAALVTALQARSYSTPDVTVDQSSSFFYDDFYIRHDIARGSLTAAANWGSDPGMTVRVDDAECIKIRFQNRAEWREYKSTGDNYYQTWVTSWREVCP